MPYRHSVEVRHEGLNKYRLIAGTDQYVVEQKARAQMAAWEEQWERKQAVEARRSEREAAARAKAEKQALAVEQGQQAERALAEIDGTLAHTLAVDDRVDWDALKDYTPFPDAAPPPPQPREMPQEPKKTEARFAPRFGLLDYVIPSRKERAIAEAHRAFELAHQQWQNQVREIEREDERRSSDHEKAVAKWRERAAEFARKQDEENSPIDARRRLYEAGDPEAIADYCDLVLSSSSYPDYFPQDFDLEYGPENGILIVDYSLPAPEQTPTVKEVRYVQSGDELREVTASKAEANKRYDSLLYQICLRTIHELFEADVVDALRAIVFNGWVRSVDSGTGQDVTACVMSVQAQKEAFGAFDLSRVDPKACFKSLKGIGSSKLHGLAPIAPVLTMSKSDSRFVQGREVISQVDDSVNLAAMDWQDFEHLIRELFEAEFVSTGGEVKVTQASRDGGVDAVAFDPDPIRGGKIVIQAKRYTNVVGISAVRDLYGTVVNEGAIKGILVTTADYGPDAYEFAKDKPLTLLSGGNLLHLLAKHGHSARIDIAEARLALGNNE